MKLLVIALFATIPGKDLIGAQKTKEGYCGAVACTANAQNVTGMEGCLKEEFGSQATPQNGIPVLSFPQDDDYWKASRCWQGYQYPAAVVYVKNENEVERAMECAIDNGYRISPRGGGHSYQCSSTMSGYVVIDMKHTCDPTKIIVDKTDTGKHILPNSKYIGTIRAQAGCTNAVMLHTAHTRFNKDDNAMALIGTCPSVGVTGFTLGGGSGDATPYTGYAADVLKEVEMLVYDGSKIKKVIANENENSDLYWATRGGGGINGLITHLTYKVVQAPASKFTALLISYDVYGSENDDEEKLRAFLKRFQDFLYSADPEESGKFGGSGVISPVISFLSFLYLGSWQDAVRHLKDARLLDDDMLVASPTLFMEDYDIKCDGTSACDFDGIPKNGLNIAEFDAYAEAMAYRLIQGVSSNSFWTQTTGNFCEDLDIDDTKYCTDNIGGYDPFIYRIPKTTEKVVIDAVLDAAGDPKSFLNEHGPSEKAVEKGTGMTPKEYFTSAGRQLTDIGGFMLPELSIDTLANIAQTQIFAAHFQHGAPLQVSKKETAFFWRNAAIMTTRTDELAKLITEEDPSKVQGYYNYLGPIGTADWRYFYFGTNYKKLSKIKGEYDPHDIFGKPLTIDTPYTTYGDDNECSADLICPSPLKVKENKKTKNILPNVFGKHKAKITCGALVNALSDWPEECTSHQDKVVGRCCREE